MNALVDIAKKSFYSQKLNAYQPAQQLWRNIDEVGLSNKNDEMQNIFTPDTLNNFFLSTQNNSNTPNVISFCALDPSTSFAFKNVTSMEVEIAICSLKSNAIGLDDIPLKFIKIILPLLLPYLTHIFNYILTSSKFPTIWKLAKLIPIGKKTSPTTPKDYRPISILSSLSKALEKIMESQISTYLLLHNFICPDQSGFRRQHSTLSALLKIIDDLLSQLDHGRIGVLTLLDFSKAFDSVRHDLLLGQKATLTL